MKKRTQLAHPTPAPARTPAQLAADLQRHARKCAICNHPQREEIESEFLHWEDPHHIVYDFKLPSRSCVYRHADATGLALQRRLGLRGVAERVIERVDDATITADAVLRAMRIYAHITDDGQWIEPPRITIVEHRHSFANSAGPHASALSLLPVSDASVPPAFHAPATLSAPAANHLAEPGDCIPALVTDSKGPVHGAEVASASTKAPLLIQELES